ncbi:hypothetical protein BVG16_03320 [Paenibacillus selenitireducens]|uniref:Cell division protein DivIVA n=1 Tax=Paenibacillus selenitireducens TaxID=1324314 RepID=A0A1T2XNJ5_9BACL|nr:DivIVA domain-containing protein [Paenibacillus selenitireducens]OPA81355.1 hypothetical protein BVG16_03320 [Paenibacillus selenitireducens]
MKKDKGKSNHLNSVGLSLSALEIHEKEFGYSIRGYNIEEVDLYLDQIIKDYEAFHSVIQEMQKYIKDLQDEISDMPKTSQEPDSLLDRIRDLEVYCFGRMKG